MAIVLRAMRDWLNQPKRPDIDWIRQVFLPAGELTLGAAAIASWASGVGVTGGIAGVAGLAALGIRRAVVRRRDRVAGSQPADENWEGEARARGQAERDLAAAAVYTLPPFLLFPTAGYLLGLGEMGLGLAALAASSAALLPPALLAKEGLMRIVARIRRPDSRDEQEELPAGDSLADQITGG